MKKRGRPAGVLVFVQSSAPFAFAKRVEALTKAMGGAKVGKLKDMLEPKAEDRQLYVGSYMHEWDDEELDLAFACCEVVTLGFLQRTVTQRPCKQCCRFTANR